MQMLAVTFSQVLLSLKSVLPQEKQDMVCDAVGRFLTSWEEGLESGQTVTATAAAAAAATTAVDIENAILHITEAYGHATGDTTRAGVVKTLMTECFEHLKDSVGGSGHDAGAGEKCFPSLYFYEVFYSNTKGGSVRSSHSLPSAEMGSSQSHQNKVKTMMFPSSMQILCRLQVF